MNNSEKVLKKPTFVVRPSSLEVCHEEDAKKSPTKKKSSLSSLLKDPIIWVPVFRLLDIKARARILSVCKDWNRIAISSQLWSTIDLTHK